jgi:hypothetical protein
MDCVSFDFLTTKSFSRVVYYRITFSVGHHCHRKHMKQDHGLFNYIDNNAKCRHLKNWPVKGLCGRWLSEFIDWSYSQSCQYFWPSFVNCFPCNLLSLVQRYPPLPLPCVNKYILSTYSVCKWGGGGVQGSGPQTDKHLPQSPFTGQFFCWWHFALPSMSLFFVRIEYNLNINQENDLNFSEKSFVLGILYFGLVQFA